MARSGPFDGPLDPAVGWWGLGNLGGDAVQELPLQGHVVGGDGDLTIQALKRMRHLGGDLEAQAGEVSAFQLGQALLALGGSRRSGG